MLSTYVPIALALLGTALMAVVIFAPVPVPAAVTMSFAPPIASPYEPREYEPPVFEPSRYELLAFDAMPPEEPSASSPGSEARWPVLVDPAAFACDAATRLELVRALASVRGSWADAILRQALADERDASVRDAILRETAAPS
jgi:hypothetical protein